MEVTKSFLTIKDYNVITIDSLETSLETFYTTLPFSNSALKKTKLSGITILRSMNH